MAGGLLNLVSVGEANVILNGNPKKTFFKTSYKTYTNFGLQKFRLDFDGQRYLRLNEASRYRFIIPRYADLLMDTYLVINLPTIWSPIYPPQDCSSCWQPYEFKWIENLGTQMIDEIEFSVGGQVLQKVSGQYLYNLVERDWSGTKKTLYYRMTGNVAELNDPANAYGRNGQYPNAYYTTSVTGPEPSIRARQLYIPINVWFGLTTQQAFPLVSMQYNQLQIDVTLRPIGDLCVIKDIEAGDGNYIRPNFNNPLHGFYRFLQPPPSANLYPDEYVDRRTNWNADVHLMATYGFLEHEEVRLFAAQPQKYLIKEVYEYTFNNTVGSGKVEIDSLAVVSNWMWYFQRSDVKLRNEHSNYTNWAYKNDQPSPIAIANASLPAIDLSCGGGPVTPNYNPCIDGSSNLYITGDYFEGNQRYIMDSWAILMDGKYREDTLPSGVYNYVEKYLRTGGVAPDGLYCYNFCLNTSPFDLQPSGGMNMSKFRTIEFEYKTYYPPMDASAQFYTICDPSSGLPIAVNKPSWRVFDYTYDLRIMEERYNVIEFRSGNAGLMYAR